MTRLIFKGRVQGVGFRAAAHLIAQRLHLQLQASNLPNGDVEILLTNPSPSALNSLILELKDSFDITSIQQYP